MVRTEVLSLAGALKENGTLKEELSPYEKRKAGVYSILDWIERTQPQIPQVEKTKTREIINRIYREFENPEELRKNANIDPEAKLGAFLVHSRRTEECDPQLDDVGRCLPAFAQKYGVSERVVEHVWNSLPTFRIGDMKGTTIDGKKIHIVELSTQISPGMIEQLGRESVSKKVAYVRNKAEESVKFAENIGCNTAVGLGEILASMTDHGRYLQKRYPETKIITGHAMTSASIMEKIENAIRLNNTTLTDTTLAIIGANGAIGSSITRLSAERGIGGLVLHEREGEDMQRHLEKIRLELEREFPHLQERITVNTGNNSLRKTFSSANIVVSAASVPEPFITAEMIRNGSEPITFIDDGQPPAMTLEEAIKAGILLEWPVIDIPEFTSTFDYGIGNKKWPCEAEVIAVLSGQDLVTVGPVNTSMVIAAGRAWKNLGFRTSKPQSFGQPRSIDRTPALA